MTHVQSGGFPSSVTLSETPSQTCQGADVGEPSPGVILFLTKHCGEPVTLCPGGCAQGSGPRGPHSPGSPPRTAYLLGKTGIHQAARGPSAPKGSYLSCFPSSITAAIPSEGHESRHSPSVFTPGR